MMKEWCICAKIVVGNVRSTLAPNTAVCMAECAQCRFLQGAVFAAVIGRVGAFAPLSPVCNLFHRCRVLSFFIRCNFCITTCLFAIRSLRLLLENYGKKWYIKKKSEEESTFLEKLKTNHQCCQMWRFYDKLAIF